MPTILPHGPPLRRRLCTRAFTKAALRILLRHYRELRRAQGAVEVKELRAACWPFVPEAFTSILRVGVARGLVVVTESGHVKRTNHNDQKPATPIVAAALGVEVAELTEPARVPA